MNRHLEQCAGCRADLAAEQDLFGALADPELQARVLAAPPPLPSHFTAVVMARVREEAATPWRLWPWLAGKWTGVQWTNMAYALSAVLVVSAGSSEFLRFRIFAWLVPVLDVASGLWADATVFAVQRQVMFQQFWAALWG